MFHVQCPGCLTQAFLECGCPSGYVDAVGAHHPDCAMTDIDAAITCPPGSACCAEDHDHAAAANACPGGHQDAACPEPDACKLWAGVTADVAHPLYAGDHPLLAGHQPGDPVPPCPGGHCHKDLDGCTVCRPLVISAPSGGYTVIQTAGI